MAVKQDRNRLREVKIRVAVRREDIARLRKEIADLDAEAKELRDRLAAAQKRQGPAPETPTAATAVFSGANIFGSQGM